MTTVQSPDWPGSAGSVDQKLVLDLGCLSAQLLAVVGGKAANLGELIGAGFPVSTGFCVTTEAYQRVAADAFDVGAPNSIFSRRASSHRDPYLAGTCRCC